MSRSGYNEEDCDNWALIKWRGQVASATRGKRGQALLRELLAALEAMPEKKLYSGSFATADGEFCTLGVLGAKRGTKMDDLGDAYAGCDTDLVGERFGIARQLAAEIMFYNDEAIGDWDWIDVEINGPLRPFDRRTQSVRVPTVDAASRRWAFMREWVEKHIVPEKVTS